MREEKKRKASPSRLTTYEAHTVALEKELVIPIPSDPYPKVSAPLSKMVAGGRPSAPRSTVTPTRTVEHALHKLPGTKGCLFGPKRVPRPLLEQHSSHSHRQHNSGCLHK